MGREADQALLKRRGHSFFKVLIDNFSNQLEIPKAFVRYFGAIHRKIKLCSHARGFWHVDVKQVGNCLFFQNGWEAFVKDHQLEAGDFLVFTRSGKSRFNVKIFGINGCRKEVDVAANENRKPLSCNENKKVKREQHQAVRRNMERDGEGHLGESPRSENVGKRPVLKIEEDESDVSVEILDVAPPKSLVPHTPPKGSSQESGSRVRPANRRSHHYKFPGMAAAEERANAFKSENPFFVVRMIPGYSLEYVHVSAEFARKYLSGKHNVNVTLRVSEERTWTVKYKKSVRRRVVDARFSTGWKFFVQDNHLKAGDVCVYELIKFPANTFNVVIFRAVEDYPLDNSVSEQPIIAPQVEESDDSSIEILGENLPCKRRGTIHRTSTSANLHPSAIHFDTGGTHTKSIKVERKLYQSEQDFYQGKRGQVNPEERPSVEPSPLSTSSPRAEETSDEKYPFFRVTISMPYMLNACLNVPIRIGRLMKSSRMTAKLQFADRIWPVKCVTYHNCQCKLNRGWPEFIKDNAIQKGDECLFELVDTDKGLFRVSVFRH